MIQARTSFNQAARLTARSPAKLIISGEHSVLYGQAAIAMAINRYTSTTTSWHDTADLYFKMSDLDYNKSLSLKALSSLSTELQLNYSDFLAGKHNIRAVLKQPFELLQFSVSKLIDGQKISLPSGVEIAVDSNIPIGCGMGSSASAIMSTLYALTNFLEINWHVNDYLRFGIELENLQHGRSSGVDLHLVTYGGCVRFQDGQLQLLQAPTMPMYIVNTGQPLTTTGECVTKVADSFESDPRLATEFGAVTAAVDKALAANDLSGFKLAIKANHALLMRIGVVPKKVSNFISDIEEHGGVAKVCGAGATDGDNAGIVLVVTDNDLQHIVTKHGYQLQTIEVDTSGTTII